VTGWDEWEGDSATMGGTPGRRGGECGRRMEGGDGGGGAGATTSCVRGQWAEWEDPSDE